MARKKVEIELSAVDKASLVFSKAGKSVDAFKGKLSGLSGSLAGAFSGVGAAGIGAGVSGALGLDSAITEAGKFERALFNMSKVSDESTADIRKKMQAIPASIGSVTENTQAYYQVMSAGVTDAAQAMDTLTIASKLAAVAEVTGSEAIQALTKMMAGYRGEIKSVADASDLLLDIEQLGQTNVKELIPVIGDLSSSSQLAGVSVKEMAAGLAVLTQTAGSTSQAATQFKALEQVFLNPNESLKKMLAALGYTDGGQMVKDRGLVGAIQTIGATAEQSKIPLASLLGSSEALAAFSGIAANGFESFISTMNKVGTQAGRTQKSFEEFEKTFDGVAAEGKASLANFATAWGEGFLPVVKDALTEFNRYVANNQETVRQWGESGGKTLISLRNGVDGLKTLWDSLPDDVKGPAGYGIIGGMLFGKKGAVLGLALSLGDAIKGSMAGFNAWQSGIISFGEYATSNKDELADLVAQRTKNNAQATASENSQASELLVKGKVKENIAVTPTPSDVMGGLTTASQSVKGAPFTLPSFEGVTIGGSKKSGADGASQIASAKEKIQELREEIAKLNGETSASGTDFAKKLRDIAETGAKAKMSTADITALQEQYASAFQADALKEFDKELATVSGNAQKLRELETGQTMEEWKNRFTEMGLSAEDAAPKLAALQDALGKQNKLEDLQTAVSFYKELGDMSGTYGESLAAQNQLIIAQGDAYRQAGISDELVKQWEGLQRIQTARDPWSGMQRSMEKFYADSTNYAAQMETIWGNVMDGLTDGLTNFVMTGKLDFEELANSFIQQVIRMQMQALVSGLFSGIGNVVGGLFGSSSVSGAASKVSSVASSVGSSGGIFSGIASVFGFHDGGTVGVDTPSFTRVLPSAVFANAPRFHSGGGFGSNEYPAVLLRGERVLNPAETYAYNAGQRAGGASTTAAQPIVNMEVIIHNEGGTQVRETRQRQTSFDGQKMVAELWISAYQNNTSGMRSLIAQGG